MKTLDAVAVAQVSGGKGTSRGELVERAVEGAIEGVIKGIEDLASKYL